MTHYINLNNNLNPHLSLWDRTRKNPPVYYGHLSSEQGKNFPVRGRIDFNHTFVTGGEDVGAFSFQANLALDNFRNRVGQVVVDSYNGFLDDVIANVPPDEICNLGWFDPSLPSCPSLNLLGIGQNGGSVVKSADLIMEVFKTASPSHWRSSVRMRDLLLHTTRLVLSEFDEPDTDILLRVLQNKSLRDSLIDGATSLPQSSIQYWSETWGNLGDETQRLTLAITRRYVGFVVDSRPSRHAMGMNKSTISIGDYLNNGKTLLVGFQQDHLITGRFKKIFVGMLLQQVYSVISQRDSRKESRTLWGLLRDIVSQSRAPSSVMILDGFRPFVESSSEMLETILRDMSCKQHEMVLVTRILGKLVENPELYNVIMECCATKLFYRFSNRQDAVMSAEAMNNPSFSWTDLTTLRRNHACLFQRGKAPSTTAIKMRSLPKREWDLPVGLGYAATDYDHLPTPQWDGLTRATHSLLDEYDTEGRSGDHPAERLRHAHALAKKNKFSAIQYLADLDEEEWKSVWNEQIAIDHWQSKVLTEHITANSTREYVMVVKDILVLRDGIRPTMSDAELYRRNHLL